MTRYCLTGVEKPPKRGKRIPVALTDATMDERLNLSLIHIWWNMRFWSWQPSGHGTFARKRSDAPHQSFSCIRPEYWQGIYKIPEKWIGPQIWFTETIPGTFGKDQLSGHQKSTGTARQSSPGSMHPCRPGTACKKAVGNHLFIGHGSDRTDHVYMWRKSLRTYLPWNKITVNISPMAVSLGGKDE